MKDSFLLYTEHSELVEQLSDAQAGTLLKSLFSYIQKGEIPELDSMSKLVFTAIRQDLDRNAQKYEEKCEKMRQNGLKGGRGKYGGKSGGSGKSGDESEDLPQGEQTEPLQQDVQNDETREEISSNREDLNLSQNNLSQNNLPQNNLPRNNLPPKKAIAFSENQMVFSESKKSFYDNVNDNVNENENVNDNVLSLSYGEKISKDEREIIENYVRKNKLATKSVSAYCAKLISNGDYKGILAKEKKKSNPKKSREEKIRAELATIHDKRSAAKVLAPYYNRGEPPDEFEEIMKKYDLDTFDKAEKYTHELWLEAQKSRAP